jgi:hypothetical protein
MATWRSPASSRPVCRRLSKRRRAGGHRDEPTDLSDHHSDGADKDDRRSGEYSRAIRQDDNVDYGPSTDDDDNVTAPRT